MSIKTNRAACNTNTTFMILITSYIPYSQKVGETTNEELHSKIFCNRKKKKEKGADDIDKSNVFNIPDILLHQ